LQAASGNSMAKASAFQRIESPLLIVLQIDCAALALGSIP
jgi:hypothetical protein